MTHAMTLRLPDELHEALRQEAFDRHTTITAVILERLERPNPRPPLAERLRAARTPGADQR